MGAGGSLPIAYIVFINKHNIVLSTVLLISVCVMGAGGSLPIAYIVLSTNVCVMGVGGSLPIEKCYHV